MNVSVYGTEATALLLGSFFHLRGYRVTFRATGGEAQNPQRIRLVLPDKWLQPGGFAKLPAGTEELVFFCDGAAAAQQLEALSAALPETATLLYDGSGEELPTGGGLRFLPLWDAASLQAEQVELFSRRPVLICEKKQGLARALAPLRQCGLRLKFTDELQACRAAVYVYKSLELPVAMCHSTLPHFLSYADGRKLAENLLEEGLKVYAQLGSRVASLPVMDPARLLQRLRKKAQSFRVQRYLPQRQLNPLLVTRLKQQEPQPRVNHHLQALAEEAGIEAFWNRKLLSLFAKRQQPWKDPVELLKAVE